MELYIHVLMCCKWRIIPLLLVCSLLVDSVAGVKIDSQEDKENNKGFGIQPFEGTDLLVLNCNGTHLPNNVKALSYMSLEKLTKDSTDPQIMASMLKGEGVKLENVNNAANVFITGHFDKDDVRATTLSAILPFDFIQVGVTYGCRISFVGRRGIPKIDYRELRVTDRDIRALRPTLPPSPTTTTASSVTPEVPALGRSSQGESSAASDFDIFSGEWNIQKVLLLVLIVMVLVLTGVCTVLMAVRCKGQPPQPIYSDRSMSWNNMKTFDPDLGPLPPLPGQGQGNSYNTMRSHRSHRSNNYDDDTYASVRYIPPWDEQGGFMTGTFKQEGKPLPSPMD